MAKRWSPKAPETADVRSVGRAVISVLTELRDGQVLGVKRRSHLSAAIHHVSQILSDANDVDLSTPSCTISSDARSRRTRSNSAVRRDLAKFRSEITQPKPVVTTGDVRWDLIRLRDRGRSR